MLYLMLKVKFTLTPRFIVKTVQESLITFEHIKGSYFKLSSLAKLK